MAIRAVHLAFHARLVSREHGLRYLGPTLRGAFGRAFKDAVCQVGHGQCRRCSLRDVCPYPQVFEGRPPLDRSVLRRQQAGPQPFVLEVAEPGQWWGRSDELRWGLRLFGEASALWPQALEAFQRLGKMGLGAKRVGYNLSEVRDARDGRLLWTPDEQTVSPPGEYRIVANAPEESELLRWRFHTPVHLRAGGGFMRHLDGLSLVLAGRRRWRLLDGLYGDGESGDATSGARLERDDFEIVEQSVRAWSFTRWSPRQQQRMKLPGLVGEAVIRGPWSRAGPWLPTIGEIHLGKYASFGFGRVSWRPA